MAVACCLNTTRSPLRRLMLPGTASGHACISARGRPLMGSTKELTDAGVAAAAEAERNFP